MKTKLDAVATIAVRTRGRMFGPGAPEPPDLPEQVFEAVVAALVRAVVAQYQCEYCVPCTSRPGEEAA